MSASLIALVVRRLPHIGPNDFSSTRPVLCRSRKALKCGCEMPMTKLTWRRPASCRLVWRRTGRSSLSGGRRRRTCATCSTWPCSTSSRCRRRPTRFRSARRCRDRSATTSWPAAPPSVTRGSSEAGHTEPRGSDRNKRGDVLDRRHERSTWYLICRRTSLCSALFYNVNCCVRIDVVDSQDSRVG